MIASAWRAGRPKGAASGSSPNPVPLFASRSTEMVDNFVEKAARWFRTMNNSLTFKALPRK